MDKAPAKIGSRRELFVDDWFIQEMQGCRLQLAQPERQEVVLQAQAPTETACAGYYHLFRDRARTLLYYRGYTPVRPGGGDHDVAQTCNLAVSRDGVQFERPALGLVEFAGSTANNIVWQGIQAHNMFVFRDDNPATPAEARFKAVGGPWEALYGLVSPDGIHWRLLRDEKLEISGAFDSLNVVFWHGATARYRMFSRYWDPVGKVRAVQSCESTDFIHWTKPVPHHYHAGVPLEHFYTNATVPCPGADHILLSFPKRFLPERTRATAGMEYPGEGLSDAVFMTSRDGVHWDRTFLEAWLRPGPDPRNWTHRNIMPATGIIETGPDEWSLYVSEHYGWSDNRLRRVTVGAHRLASVHAGAAGGTMTTRLFHLPGTTLCLNASTSAAGSVQVEVQDANGCPLASCALDDMTPWFGDEMDAPMAWQRKPDLAMYVGQPVRLRFALKDADLYALRFT